MKKCTKCKETKDFACFSKRGKGYKSHCKDCLKAIERFYKNCPPGYHVDHIIPLNHKNIQGLHVIENLQYLPANENLKKSNKFDGTLKNNSWRNN